ncbi:MAG: relaxase MobL, partial [Planococcus donghaensis]
MKNVTPAIIIKSKFVTPSQREKSGNYQEFLNYMDRKDTHAHENEFLEYETYQDYMANDEKSTGLFSENNDSLNENDKE